MTKKLDVIRSFFEALKSRDIKVVGEFFDPQMIFKNGAMDAISGEEAVKARFSEVFEHYSDSPFEAVIHLIVPAGDHVLVEFSTSLRSTSGEVVSGLPAMSDFRLRGDKICYWRTYLDRASWVDQLGRKFPNVCTSVLPELVTA